jgi:hypothetical protein
MVLLSRFSMLKVSSRSVLIFALFLASMPLKISMSVMR